jgi:hypothetical protein
MFHIYYNTHHNWEWVVDEAISDLCHLSIKRCRLLRELPSQQNCPEKPTYSLFRIECATDFNLYSTWVSSTAFSFLDFKDFLCSSLQANHSENVMPFTSLIEWNISSIDDINWEFNSDHLQSNCALLKAACGSGGFGLYKVYSKNDVLQIIKFHAEKAKSHEGFVENLCATNNGNMPRWSLQTFLNSVRVLDHRKCQVRAYVVYCQETKNMYLYKDFEVRLPFWEDDNDNFTCCTDSNGNVTTVVTNTNLVPEFERLCVKNTNAIPYNRHRMKENTERYMLMELSEISCAQDDIRNCVIIAMCALKSSLRSHIYKPDPNNIKSNKASIAIAGIDLILYESIDNITGTKTLIPKILEINNNPAMPQISKKMSENYRRHLRSFVYNTIQLGLGISQLLADISQLSDDHMKQNNNNNNNNTNTNNNPHNYINSHETNNYEII